MFIIEDEVHAEFYGEFKTLKSAISALKELSQVPWNLKPNICPCQSWKTCGREYSIVEFDISKNPWEELNRTPALSISAKRIQWHGALNEPS